MQLIYLLFCTCLTLYTVYFALAYTIYTVLISRSAPISRAPSGYSFTPTIGR
nr:MAG TPA: Myc target protein 1 [Caudoviricetes sp.]